MELRQLVYFDAVVREGGFTKAARRLRVAQPAISAQVKQLEAELGVALLDRRVRPAARTHAGELFHVRVQQALAQLEAARREMGEVAVLVRGTVRIAATPVLGTVDLVVAMASFRHRYPGVSLTLRTGLLEDLVADLDAGVVDLVIGPEHAGLAAHHDAQHLADEHLVLAVPPRHQLAASNGVRLAECREEPFICLPPGSGMHKLLLQAASAAGFEPKIDFQADTPGTIRAMVAAGLGVAVMAASTASGPGPEVVIRTFPEAPQHPPIAVITAAGPLEAGPRAFVAHLTADQARLRSVRRGPVHWPAPVTLATRGS